MYDRFLGTLLENIKDNYTKWSSNSAYGNMVPARLKDEPVVRRGRKFDRIFRGNSIWGFVAKKDGVHKGINYRMGDVFKAQGLHQPAKHVRGSIFDNNTDWFSWTGPEYMIRKKARLSNQDAK